MKKVSVLKRGRGRPRKLKRSTVGRKVQHKNGYLVLSRKCKEITLQGSQILAGQFGVVDNNTLSCLQTSVAETTAVVNHYNIPFALKFAMSQILNYGDITSLADQYRLKKTVIKIYYNSNSSQVSNYVMLPQLTYCYDNDDATVPTSDQIREKMGARMRYFDNKNHITLVIYPKCAPIVYNNGIVLNAQAIGKSTWINSSYPNCEHYGLKGVLQNVYIPGTALTQPTFKFDVTHHLEAKDFQ